MSATTSSLISELAGYAEQFATVKQDAQQLVARLQEGPLNWRPAPGAWSIAGFSVGLRDFLRAGL